MKKYHEIQFYNTDLLGSDNRFLIDNKSKREENII